MSRPGPASCATTPRPGCCARRSRCRRSRPCSATPAQESTNLYMSVDRDRLLDCVLAGSRRCAVMSGHGFTSAFAAELDAYLAFKENMGFYGASRVWYLKRFDAYCAEHDRTVFDRDTVEGWVTAQLESSGRYRSWMSYIRDFGRWLQATGASDAYVLSDRWKAPFVPAAPLPAERAGDRAVLHSGSGTQVPVPVAMAGGRVLHADALVRAAEPGRSAPCSPSTSTCDEGHIDVVWSKGNRSRRLPLTGQVIGVLAACDRTSRAHFAVAQRRSSSPPPATRSPRRRSEQVFDRIWDQAGLARPTGGRQPRPYDFRHHFAYANIERWMAAGQATSPRCCPTCPATWATRPSSSTYYYIHTSPDFMDSYAEITQDSQSVLPEVGFE